MSTKRTVAGAAAASHSPCHPVTLSPCHPLSALCASAVICLLVAMSGCRPVPERPAPAAWVAVTDATNRSVTFARAPRRIVSLAPSHTETLFAMGLGSRF